jgi:hypothetical protein
MKIAKKMPEFKNISVDKFKKIYDKYIYNSNIIMDVD